MGLLIFSTNVTLDGCLDRQEGIADNEMHAFFTRFMDESGVTLWGRVAYEMMESYWPAVARDEAEVPPPIREWAVKLGAKPKYVVSSTRYELPGTIAIIPPAICEKAYRNSRLRPRWSVLLGSGKLAADLDGLDLIEEYKFLVHPRLVEHGPTLYETGLPRARQLELVSAKPLRNGIVAIHYRRSLTKVAREQ